MSQYVQLSQWNLSHLHLSRHGNCHEASLFHLVKGHSPRLLHSFESFIRLVMLVIGWRLNEMHVDQSLTVRSQHFNKDKLPDTVPFKTFQTREEASKHFYLWLQPSRSKPEYLVSKTNDHLEDWRCFKVSSTSMLTLHSFPLEYLAWLESRTFTSWILELIYSQFSWSLVHMV